MYENPKTHIKFTYFHEGLSGSHPFPETTVEHTIDGESTIHECIEAFENFLLGCGYRLNKGESLGVIEND